jgi:hypothetical protein
MKMCDLYTAARQSAANENSPVDAGLFETACNEEDSATIADVDHAVFARAQQHWDDSAEGLKVQHYKAMKERAAEYEAARVAGAAAIAKARTVKSLTRHCEKLEASLMVVAISNSLGGAAAA